LTICKAVAWNGSLWVAGGEGDETTLVYSDDNGTTWTLSFNGGEIFTTSCDSIAWNGSLWVAGGTGTNKVATSSDGSTWTSSPSNSEFTTCESLASRRVLPYVGTKVSSSETWNTYTPVWTGSPSVVNTNGTLTGRYKIIGKTAFINIVLGIDGTSDPPTAYWMISLPPDAVPKESNSIILPTVYKTGTELYTGLSYIDASRNSSNIIPFTNDSPSVPVNKTAPAIWGTVNTDTVTISGSYEIT
jgi:hypothetical protein